MSLPAVELPDVPEPRIAYQSDRVTLWHGDAADVLVRPELGKESVDLVIADPPYGMDFISGMRKEKFRPIHGDQAHLLDNVRDVLALSARCTRQARHMYVFGPRTLLDGLVVSETVEMVWDKGAVGMGDLTSPWGPQHEPIAFCVPMTRHAGKTGKPVLPARLRKGTVLRFGRRTGRTVRASTEKPVPLLRELIESSSRFNDLVLDPYCGSGSTAVAAILSGRRCVTVEIDAEAIPLAIERIKSAERVADQMVTC